MGEGQARAARTRGARRAAPTSCAARPALAAAGLAGLLLAPGAVAAPCAPWPGEPTPLPRVDDPDDMRARWASLRVSELTRLASAYEESAPAIANRLWRRVLCLDPADDGAVAGLARTPLVRVHQPLLVRGVVPDESREPWAGLGRPLGLRIEPRPRTPPTPEPEPPPDRFGSGLASARELLHAARFEQTLEAADTARRAADAPGASATAERRAELEVIAASAALALNRTAEADASLARALEADPDLTLDPAETPPKVRRALERVRARRSAP